MSDPRIKVILFDLGGVLVDWAGTRELVTLSGGTLSNEQSRRFWLFSEWMRKFEIGGCTPEQFAEGMVSELGLSLSPEDFLRHFISWDRGFLPGATNLLEVLMPRYYLACLSNTNVLHWTKLCKEQNLLQRFHRLYISFETGFLKPSSEAFQYVIKDIGHKPHSILFFDDNQECVDTANSLGFQAFQVSGIEETCTVLNKLEIFI
ncbi:MAG: hypothetical protein AMS17_03635 [Spirochaetes bacterium DG_61]|nr:MAG: hypothetical protein AMS17_03635 [Spirochaetes bacterium DG_61]